MRSKPIPLADWQADMDRRGRLDCKFRCPACGNTASPNDFKAAGGDPQRAPHECIGRLAPGTGCNWVAWGLFDICTVHIDTGEKIVAVFAFADAERP